jgi:hypothetical protein
MTAVTLNVDEDLLEKAKAGLQQRGLTLEELFSNALTPYAEGEATIREYEGLLRRHFYLRHAKPYTQDEVNEPPLVAFKQHSPK